MKTPPLFAVCFADAQVKAMLGANPMRLYQFGLAPQNAQKPYAVWQSVFGFPENYLGQRPDAESHTIQIDVYADSSAAARQVLHAIEYAVELQCYITRYGPDDRDIETMDYTTSMDISWITNR